MGTRCGLAPDTTATVRVVAVKLADTEFGNPVALVGLQSLSGDEGIIRVERVGRRHCRRNVVGASPGARGQGNSQLAVQGSGIFSNLTGDRQSLTG